MATDKEIEAAARVWLKGHQFLRLEDCLSVAKAALTAAEQVRASEPIAYLHEVDAGTDNACWAVCSKGDPGYRPVFLYD